MSLNLLSLDFDGVCHRASDSVLINFRQGTPAWQMELGLKAQKRFIWAPLLADLLVDTDVAIVIHSTWRKRYDDATLKHFLPPEISRRVISLDGQIEGREVLPSDEYLAAAIDLIAPSSVCVLDDRPEFFPSTGKVHNWIGQNHGSFVWCDGDVGVTDINIRQHLQAWIKSLPDHEPAPANPANSPS
ncbi:HAD domain-containing protein [Polaromonas sp.]|uniref:HAD domain-containing protein n=1 Tax=Polaromonas sp. TaxID=1869339 RepID=UPI00352B2A3C